MSLRSLILLSPYRIPAQNPLMLGDEESASFLNGVSALWHPAALAGAGGPPQIASPYDHEQPSAGHIYAVPETPPLVLPEDWHERVRGAGAVTFRATPDRAETLANLLDALRQDPGLSGKELLVLGPHKVGPFLGIGFGQRMIETLFEAMEHDYVLPGGDFWQDVQAGVAALQDPDPDAFRRRLQTAADPLLSAPRRFYP